MLPTEIIIRQTDCYCNGKRSQVENIFAAAIGLRYNQGMRETEKGTDQAVISRAMGLLGKRTSAKKAAAVRMNGAATRFQAKPLAELDCNCDALADDAHKATCPRGRAYRRRQKQGTIKSNGSGAALSQAPEDESFKAMAARKREKLHALMEAPDAQREAALTASAPIAAMHFATPEGQAELADWRATQGEPFHD